MPKSDVGMPVVGRWEPIMAHCFMPRCPACHAAHPLARKPAAPPEACPDCGHPSAAPAEVVRVSTSGGLWLWLANSCHALARWLVKASNKV
jgi:hypothetical protein